MAPRHVMATAPIRMAESIEMDSAILDRYMSLPVTGKVQAEYIFIDADGDVRSKCRTLASNKVALDQLPDWKCASQTGVESALESVLFPPSILRRALPRARPSTALTPIRIHALSLSHRVTARSYDGSSTNQAPGEDSEVIIKPRAIFKDPFRGGDNILVMTDAYTPAGVPLPTNTRAPAADIFDKYEKAGNDKDPWFGLEQEYTLCERPAAS